jgi:hypothetical protein
MCRNVEEEEEEEEEEVYLSKLIISHEETFHMSGIVTRYNCRI